MEKKPKDEFAVTSESKYTEEAFAESSANSALAQYEDGSTGSRCHTFAQRSLGGTLPGMDLHHTHQPQALLH